MSEPPIRTAQEIADEYGIEMPTEAPDWDDGPAELTSAEINLFGALIITLNRIYDAQLMLLMQTNPDDAAALRAMHERGEFFAPPPVFMEDDEE